MLDDANLLKQRDPSGALFVAGTQYKQINRPTINCAENDHREINSIVFAGMGGSALSASIAKVWLKSELSVPFEIIRSYSLPKSVGTDTLVIVSSYSGNSEEVLCCLRQAQERSAQIAIITSGGELMKLAKESDIAHVALPLGFQPRYGVIYNLCALGALMANFELLSEDKLAELESAADWLQQESAKWTADVPLANNNAKKLALSAVGKTAVFYGGELTAPVAYKWKISWNENAKNVAFWNEYPEFNHNEFLGWASHPIDKPFAVFDIISSLESQKILKRFMISDRLLSGLRPKSMIIDLAGDTLIKQILWGSILADFVSIYLAILNNVDPTPVALIEKLKSELV